MKAADSIRVMAALHGLFAGAQLLFGSFFANAANHAANLTGTWVLRLEGVAMVAMGALLISVAFGMARLRPWTLRVAPVYTGLTILWACAALIANLILRTGDTFDPPRNLFGLLVVIVVHAIALMYDTTRKDTRAVYTKAE